MNAPDRHRLARLKAQLRRPGEASFFWYEPQLGCEAVKVLPGEYFVANEDLAIMTTLGSCIAACLWDRNARVGGMNHFLLPDSGGGGSAIGSGGRYGAFAMEQLINALIKLGATRTGLEAKVFGGASVVAGMQQSNVGERNTEFVMQYLSTERIPVVSKDVLDIYPRKVCFLPTGGKALVKRLSSSHGPSVTAQERHSARPPEVAGGTIDLF